MNRLSRLRWIPMIVKAYSDARLHHELELRQQVQNGPQGDSSTKSAKSGNIRKRTSPANRTFAGMRASPPSVRPVKARKIPQKTQSADYKSVLKELRETKRKLNQLESIHTQLTQLQQNMDERLMDLLQRLEQPQASSWSQPVVRQPGSHFRNEK